MWQLECGLRPEVAMGAYAPEGKCRRRKAELKRNFEMALQTHTEKLRHNKSLLICWWMKMFLQQFNLKFT
jgi:hypothetical protein